MANDNPFSVPDGRSRVRRNVQDAEDAANGEGRSTPTADTSTGGINFIKSGKVQTPEQKAKSGKALQDLLKKRAEKDDGGVD